MNSRILIAAARAAVLVLVLGAAACSPERDEASLFAPAAVGVPVVDAVLMVDQPLPNLRLSRTQAPDAPFDPAAAFLAGASVVIRQHGPGGSLTDRPYVQALGGPWYRPASSPAPAVQPLTRYTLEITTLAGETITAGTTTPDRFTIDEWVLLDDTGNVVRRRLQTFASEGDAVYDHPDNQLDYADGLLDARYTGTTAADVGAAGFQVAVFSLDRGAGYVIDPPFFEPEDFAGLPRSGASPALAGTDGFARLPWFAIYYDGRHKVRTYAVDRNWFDLVRTTSVGGGGFGFGGNFGEGTDPPAFHVDGGIGLFGSASADSNGFRINPVE